MPVDATDASESPGKIELTATTDLGCAADQNGQAIPALAFEIFQYHDHAHKGFFWDIKWAFTDLGTYSSDDAGMHFRFDGRLSDVDHCTPGGQVIDTYTFHEAIDVRKIDGTHLALHMSQSIEGGNDVSDNTYVIRSTSCDN